MWSLTSLRTKRISSFRKFRLLPPKDFFDSICQSRKSRASFNYLSRESEKGGWHGDAELFGGLQIDNHLKSGGLLDR